MGQNQAFRMVSSHIAKAQTDANRLETGAPDHWTIVDRLCVKSVEKAMRLPIGSSALKVPKNPVDRSTSDTHKFRSADVHV